MRSEWYGMYPTLAQAHRSDAQGIVRMPANEHVIAEFRCRVQPESQSQMEAGGRPQAITTYKVFADWDDVKDVRVGDVLAFDDKTVVIDTTLNVCGQGLVAEMSGHDR